MDILDSDYVLIGSLGGTRGLKGELRVRSISGEHEHFLKLKEALVQRKKSRLMNSSDNKRLLLKILEVKDSFDSLSLIFEGYDNPERARQLSGLEIYAKKSQAAQLKKDEWYVNDLIGLELIYEGEKKGRIVSLLEGGFEPWLEVELLSGKKIIIPFKAQFVGEVDIKASSIELIYGPLLESE